ncbi:pyruvate carboxylase subunit B [Bacillus sp. T33-2]|uniref:pyruvate carboxylase subunit B n=1 Tax=Bacillus sp. T33-2 TaxID=2054168 RepID=UPI0015E0D7FA|nr:pyruvate carboxylase subunit B [Bacillus sp. T33-2]
MKRRLEFVDETLRDGQQSLWATRMKTESILPVARAFNKAGFHYVTSISGAAFETCVKFLGENPWDRLRLLRQQIPDTPLSVLLRGRNVLGWKRFPDDVVELTIRALKNIGIDWIMVFDGLNDIRNLEWHIKVAKSYGMKVNGALVYSESPVHTDEYFAEKARHFKRLGVDSIMLEDASGVLTPQRTKSLMASLRRAAGEVELQFQSHCSTGQANECYIEAIKEGIDVASTAALPLSEGESVPSHIKIIHDARKLGIDVGLDERYINELDDYLHWVAYKEQKPVGKSEPFNQIEFDKYVSHQIPGGMMSNLVSQLKDLGIENRLPEVLEEAGRVRQELGYPVMVTPLSQLVGVQATFNVLEGKRYHTVPEDLRLYVRGYYGEFAAPIDQNVLDRVLRDGESDMLDPTSNFNDEYIKKARAELGHTMSDEDLLLNIFNSKRTMNEFYQNQKNLKLPISTSQPLIELIKELEKRRNVRSFFVQNGSYKVKQVF